MHFYVLLMRTVNGQRIAPVSFALVSVNTYAMHSMVLSRAYDLWRQLV